jgi:hypothetical protein
LPAELISRGEDLIRAFNDSEAIKQAVYEIYSFYDAVKAGDAVNSKLIEKYYLRHKVPIYAHRENYFNCDWRDPALPPAKEAISKIETVSQLETAITNGVPLFTFNVIESLYFVIDLDRHEGKPDGVSVFNTFLTENRINFDYLKTTFCVKTPSNGVHIYLTRNSKYSPTQLEQLPSVDVFISNKHKVSCVGSVRKNKMYAPLNGLEVATMPDRLQLLLIKTPELRTEPNKHQTSRTTGKVLPLKDKVKYCYEDFRLEVGRHNRVLKMANKVCSYYLKHREPVVKEDLINEILSNGYHDNLPENDVRNCVKDAYNHVYGGK